MLHLNRVVIIDIDGLRRDVFETELQTGNLPNLARIVGGRDAQRALNVPATSTAPSITFTAQTSIITGEHPAVHGIPGNESFDRFGRISRGRPRHFGFDVGETYAIDDAVAVFTTGLASRFVHEHAPTLYERPELDGVSSSVIYHMHGRDADHWLPPSSVDLARFTKGKGLLELDAAHYDQGMLKHTARHLKRHGRPDVLFTYFMGLDHHSHRHGPASQNAYLRDEIDPQVGQLLALLNEHGGLANTLFVLVSDHGQIDAIPDDRHSLRLGFPFDIELIHVFTALGLDVHDKPGEDPNCDAVMGLNGGLAHVYLQNRAGRWADKPRFTEDVLPVAQAFHDMNAQGKYAEELHDTLEMILIRDVEHAGWGAPFKVYDGTTQSIHPLGDYLHAHSELQYVDAEARLRGLAGSSAGDLLLVARGRDGYYFGGPTRGVHGGLLAGESDPILVFALPEGDADAVAALRDLAGGAIADRCANENNRQPSIVDMVPALLTAVNFDRG